MNEQEADAPQGGVGHSELAMVPGQPRSRVGAAQARQAQRRLLRLHGKGGKGGEAAPAASGDRHQIAQQALLTARPPIQPLSGAVEQPLAAKCTHRARTEPACGQHWPAPRHPCWRYACRPHACRQPGRVLSPPEPHLKRLPQLPPGGLIPDERRVAVVPQRRRPEGIPVALQAACGVRAVCRGWTGVEGGEAGVGLEAGFALGKAARERAACTPLPTAAQQDLERGRRLLGALLIEHPASRSAPEPCGGGDSRPGCTGDGARSGSAGGCAGCCCCCC